MTIFVYYILTLCDEDIGLYIHSLYYVGWGTFCLCIVSLYSMGWGHYWLHIHSSYSGGMRTFLITYSQFILWWDEEIFCLHTHSSYSTGWGHFCLYIHSSYAVGWGHFADIWGGLWGRGDSETDTAKYIPEFTGFIRRSTVHSKHWTHLWGYTCAVRC